MKKYFTTIFVIILFYSCNSKQNENQDSFIEETPVYEGVDSNKESDFYTLGDTTQNKNLEKEIDNENSKENTRVRISQDSAVYEGVYEE